jgi:hypothetical protein
VEVIFVEPDVTFSLFFTTPSIALSLKEKIKRKMTGSFAALQHSKTPLFD